MNMLRDAIGRNMLFPALRLMREQMKLISDPLQLRKAAARVDALGRRDADARHQPVSAGGVPATWIDVAGVSAEGGAGGAGGDGVVLYLHGGAFIAETPNFHGALLARICREAGARGLMPSYRLAPEHRYPAALDDCLAAYRWLLEQGIAATRIVVAGDSAGGNLALALLLRARDEALPLPAAAVVLSPVTDFTFSGASVRRNDGVDDMFAAASMDALVPAYLAQAELATHPHVSPLFGDYAGMPPLLLVVGSTELLLDDSVRVAQRCPGAQLQVWHGMPHVFPGFAFLPEAREATQHIGRFLRDGLAAASRPPVAADAMVASVAAADAHGLPAAPPAQAAPDAGGTDAGPAAGEPLPVRTAVSLPVHPAAAERTPRSFGAVAWLYLALAFVTGAMSLSLLVVWPALVLANPVVWAATVAALAFMAIESGAVGWRRLPWCMAATLLLGPGCGLSLFLFLRAAHPRTERAAPRAVR